MIKARVAFYKGKGDWADWAIRKYTGSAYSHTELVIDNDWYSSSPYDGKVRCAANMNYSKDSWDFVDVNIDMDKFTKHFAKTNGAKYDWLGIVLSQFLPLGIDSKKKWFCSEWCAKVLKDSGYAIGKKVSWYSPKRLYEAL